MGYVGMGKVYHRQENYDLAMKYYELGNDKAGYSKSFSEKRLILLRENFGWLIIGVIVLFILVSLLVRAMRWLLSKPDEETGKFGRAIKLIYMCMFHPGEGFLRAKQEVSLTASLILLFLFLAARFFTLKFTHFPLQSVDPAKVHELVELGRMLLPFGLWVFANWAVTAIAGSEASLKDVFIGSSICIVPYIIVVPLLTIFSHICCAHEAGAVRFDSFYHELCHGYDVPKHGKGHAQLQLETHHRYFHHVHYLYGFLRGWRSPGVWTNQPDGGFHQGGHYRDFDPISRYPRSSDIYRTALVGGG